MRILMWLVFGAASYLILGILCEVFKARKGKE